MVQYDYRGSEYIKQVIYILVNGWTERNRGGVYYIIQIRTKKLMRIIIQFNGILMFNFNFKDMRESFIIMFFIRRVSMFILMENSR